jgi:hypothetical protein
MAYAAIRSHQKHGLDCFMLTVRPSHLVGFLGHDPRSQHWKTLPPWLLSIYQEKQRVTAKARIDALETYIRTQLMDDGKVGALPPISVMQFEPFQPGQLTELQHGAVLIDLDEIEAVRVLIDGLARVTAIQKQRETLQSENPLAYEKLNQFRFCVALYVPTVKRADKTAAGQLFHDFNSYAWPVPAAKSLASDAYNRYKLIATAVADSDVLRRHGGLKSGTSNLGKKDTAFTTELMLSQLCKIAVEGQRGYGKLTKPLTDAKVTALDDATVGRQIADFLAALETAMGPTRFADRKQLFRTAHGLYAIAVIINDALFERRTTVDKAVNGLSAIDWTWANPQFRSGIGRSVDGGEWKLNTGHSTFEWLVKHCRDACSVILSKAA